MTHMAGPIVNALLLLAVVYSVDMKWVSISSELVKFLNTSPIIHCVLFENIACNHDPTDDPNYGYSDIWQCGSETNYCWYGHCKLGCCLRNGSSFCMKSGDTCDSTMLLTAKQPSNTRRPEPPNGCSTVLIGLPTSHSTGMNSSPTNTGPSNTNPSNYTSPYNTSSPNTSTSNTKVSFF